MTDLMIKDNVVAFIGPDESCLYEALVASAWNLPIISYVSFHFLLEIIFYPELKVEKQQKQSSHVPIILNVLKCK